MVNPKVSWSHFMHIIIASGFQSFQTLLEKTALKDLTGHNSNVLRALSQAKKQALMTGKETGANDMQRNRR